MARRRRLNLKQYHAGWPKVRWGHLWELDRRTRVGSPIWYERHPEWRLRKLSAWRCLHALARHTKIRWAARFQGIAPSSDIPLREMIRMVERFNESGQFLSNRQKKAGRKSKDDQPAKGARGRAAKKKKRRYRD